MKVISTRCFWNALRESVASLFEPEAGLQPFSKRQLVAPDISGKLVVMMGC